MNKIAFFNADIRSRLANKRSIKTLIESIFKTENIELKKISYIFCSDDYLFKLNKKYLNHETLTDVITFPLSEGNPIMAEVYISLERIKENAKKFKVEYQKELLRVM